MKKYVVVLMLMVLLTGCGQADTMETLSDELLVPVMAQPGHIVVELPGEAALPVFENDHGRIYVSNDYEIVIQTLDAGDLTGSMEIVSGMDRADLTVMETSQDGISRHEFVWAAAGETGEQLGRAVILDDSHYHYCLSVLRSPQGEEKSQINWDQVFASFTLA